MTSNIALFLCIIFILFLFIYDHKRNPGSTSALWIPFIWVIIMSTMNVSAWLEPGMGRGRDVLDKMAEGNVIDRITFLVLEIIGIVILIKRRAQITNLIRNNKWIFIFFLYCLISIIWSEYSFISFKRWIKTSGNIVMVLIILTEPDPVESTKTFFKRFSFLVIPLSVLFIKYFGELGRDYSPWDGTQYFTGVGQGKNSLGNMCLVGGFFLIWNLQILWYKRKIPKIKQEMLIHLFILGMIIWLLNKADSMTSVLCLIMGVTIIIIFKLPVLKKNIKYFGIYFSIFFLFGVLLEAGFDMSQVILKSVGRDITLTGRTEIWEGVLEMVQNPLLGTGYEGFWLGERLDKFWEIYWWHPRQAHNGYIETYINLGIFGIIFLVLMILNAYKNITKAAEQNFNVGIYRFSLLFVVLFYNITEAAFVGMSIIWFIFLFIAINIDSSYQLNGEDYLFKKSYS